MVIRPHKAISMWFSLSLKGKEGTEGSVAILKKQLL